MRASWASRWLLLPFKGIDWRWVTAVPVTLMIRLESPLPPRYAIDASSVIPILNKPVVIDTPFFRVLYPFWTSSSVRHCSICSSYPLYARWTLSSVRHYVITFCVFLGTSLLSVNRATRMRSRWRHGQFDGTGHWRRSTGRSWRRSWPGTDSWWWPSPSDRRSTSCVTPEVQSAARARGRNPAVQKVRSKFFQDFQRCFQQVLLNQKSYRKPSLIQNPQNLISVQIFPVEYEAFPAVQKVRRRRWRRRSAPRASEWFAAVRCFRFRWRFDRFRCRRHCGSWPDIDSVVDETAAGRGSSRRYRRSG